MSIYDEWRKGFEAGYYYGRIDELQGREYDDSTPQNRKYPKSGAQTLSAGDAVTSEREAEN